MMQVETYEVEELTTGDEEETGVCEAIVDRLELDGQKKLLSGNKTLIPYRKMTKQEYGVYHEVLGQVCDIKDYSESKIPLRILQTYEHAVSLDFFESIKVWYMPNADIKDPLLVGCTTEGQYNSTVHWILARWGEVLVPFEELAKKATETYKLKCIVAAKKIKQNAENYIQTLNNMSIEEISISHGNIPSAYGLDF